jgi:hypothetical protein
MGWIAKRRAWLSQIGLGFGIVGGPCAWFGHLLATYIIAEFGCVGESQPELVAGITRVSWMLVGASVAMTLLGLLAVGVAYRGMRVARGGGEQGQPGSEFAGQAGLITSGLSVLVIIVESLPILYYLRDC